MKYITHLSIKISLVLNMTTSAVTISSKSKYPVSRALKQSACDILPKARDARLCSVLTTPPYPLGDLIEVNKNAMLFCILRCELRAGALRCNAGLRFEVQIEVKFEA